MIDQSEIEKIAWLARLEVSGKEISDYSHDLSEILALVDEMEQVNTDSTEPLAHPLELTARLRPDEVTETNQRDRFQSIAPAIEDGHYLVPKVIE